MTKKLSAKGKIRNIKTAKKKNKRRLAFKENLNSRLRLICLKIFVNSF